MLVLSGVSSDNRVYSQICDYDVPTMRAAMLKGFQYANGWKSMCLTLNDRPIASLYRDISGTPVWR